MEKPEGPKNREEPDVPGFDTGLLILVAVLLAILFFAGR